MSFDEGRLKAIVTDLKNAGISLSDVEKEIALRNKWGRMQNDSMRPYTTQELTAAASKWQQF